MFHGYASYHAKNPGGRTCRSSLNCHKALFIYSYPESLNSLSCLLVFLDKYNRTDEYSLQAFCENVKKDLIRYTELVKKSAFRGLVVELYN